MRLPARLHVELELRDARSREPLEQARRAAARPRRSSSVSTPRGSASRRSTTARGDRLEVGAARDRLALEQAEPVARPIRERRSARRRARRPSPRPCATPAIAARIASAFSAAPARRRRRRPSRRGRPGSSASATTSAGFDACRGGLLGREDHVRVVREHDASGAGAGLDRGDDARRSTGSSTGRRSTTRAPEALEERAVPVARRRRRRRRVAAAARRARRGAAARSRSAVWRCMFAISIPSIDADARLPSASAAPGSSVWTCTLSALAVADDEQRVAEPLELALERVGVELVALDEEGRAVAVAGELLVDRVDAGLLGSTAGARAAARRVARGDDAAHDLGEPGAARVDDAGLAEHVELLRRARDARPRRARRARAGARAAAARGWPRPPRRSRGSTVSIVPSTGWRTAR